MAAEFDQIFFLHSTEQPADSLAMGMQFISYLLMSDIERFCIESF